MKRVASLNLKVLLVAGCSGSGPFGPDDGQVSADLEARFAGCVVDARHDGEADADAVYVHVTYHCGDHLQRQDAELLYVRSPGTETWRLQGYGHGGKWIGLGE